MSLLVSPALSNFSWIVDVNQSVPLLAAIYVSIFKNKAAHYVAADVVPALANAGLPPSSIPAFLAAAATGSESAFLKVPGINTKIIEVGVAALEGAYAHAFRITWLATLAFGLLSVLAACFSRNLDDKLTHDVVRRLGHGFVPGKETHVDSHTNLKAETQNGHTEKVQEMP